VTTATSDCLTCLGTGHVAEGADGELRSFDPVTEQRPDFEEVWLCPDCWWIERPGHEPVQLRDATAKDWTG
jgi:hypothetical protein